MKVYIVDFKRKFKEEKKEILKSIKKVLKKGTFILSSELDNLEKSICKFTGTRYCLGLNSGTDALMMSLWSTGISKGDEVITSPFSFVASANSIIHIGAKPVFVDVDDDLNIDPDLIEAAITKKTKAIMPVHWSGRVCKMDKIIKIAKKYNLIIIEDCAQALGAYYKKRHAGTFSKVAAFSTHPLKNLSGLGDGGFIITNDKKIYNKVKIYRNHGLKSRESADIVGVNSRLDSINAEVLNFRIKKLKKLISKRVKNVNLYKKLIKSNKIKTIEDQKFENNTYTLFTAFCEQRDKLQKYLLKFGIRTLTYYSKPLHFQKSYKFLGYNKGDFPKAEFMCKKILSFPVHEYLKENEVKYVAKKINDFYA